MDATRSRAIEARLESAARACMAHGMRLTALRGLVLRLLHEADAPITAYQLLDRLRAARGGAMPPTVYRALDFLIAQGLVHKVERLSAFVPCRDAAEHAHAAQFLICRRCGTVAEIDDRDVSSALEQAAERAGFHPGPATIEIDGTCAACAGTAA